MKIIHTKNELKAIVAAQTGSIAVVPTMGALHDGHKSLIERAVRENDFTIVSVFVNPTQFGPNEDYAKYPRTLEKDAKLCGEIGADVLFAPSAEEMYSKIYFEEKETTLVCPPYKYVNRLCGKSRPGHFDGVCTVVLKLFNLTKAKKAYFGQKDAQQLFIIKKMVEELDLDIQIFSCPIVRENDGLAISSRNTYLTKNDRKSALNLSRGLFKARDLFKNGVTDASALVDVVLSYLDDFRVDYVEVVSKEDFCPIKKAKKGGLILVAAKTPENEVRLIDNVEL